MANEERPHVWLKEGSCCCVVVVAFFEGRDLFWRGAKQVCPTILDDGFCCRFWRYFGVGFGDRSGIVLVLSLAIVLGIVLVLV